MTLKKAVLPSENGEEKAFGDLPSPRLWQAGTLPQSGTATGDPAERDDPLSVGTSSTIDCRTIIQTVYQNCGKGHSSSLTISAIFCE